jgi:hypothetical protein
MYMFNKKIILFLIITFCLVDFFFFQYVQNKRVKIYESKKQNFTGITKEKAINIFDKLINLIYHKRKAVEINIDSKKSEFIPKIYYIGNGKTGSTSIKAGFYNINVAHWHSVKHFEKLYQTKLLSSNKYNLYDLIIYIGNKYKFKPVIIESVRNVIDVGISRIFQHIKLDRGPNDYKGKKIKKYKSDNNINGIIKIIKNNINESLRTIPYSCKMFKKYYNIDLISNFDKDLNYYFNDINNVYLLVLKFEDIKNWEKIINNNLPYKFVLTHHNKTDDKFYGIVKKNIKFTKKELEPLLNCDKMTFFYTNDEINNISKKFIVN